MSNRYSVAIVGAGFSGLLLALQLLRKGPPALTVALIERTPGYGLGLAYRTQNPEHLLNVRVGNMSPFPDQPRDLAHWLARETGETIDPASFISRETYGRYLRTLLADNLRDPLTAARLILMPDEATDLERGPGGMSVTLAMGTKIEATRVVLAPGALGMASPFPGLGALPPPLYASDPWAPDALDDLPPDATVLLLGSGLTMIDIALSLARRGHEGAVLSLSRRGLTPRSHAEVWAAAAAPVSIPPAPLSQLVRWTRRRADAVGWRAAIDDLRPQTQAFWQGASPDVRRRFLRHLRPWWDVHRHRMAPPVAARVDAMRRGGALSVAAGRLLQAEARGDRVAVVWRPRGERGERRGEFGRIINCAGAAADGGGSALLRVLVERGEARPDPLGLGLDVSRQGQVVLADGALHPSLFALGPITRGAFWESIAVPDIRNQAAHLAEHLVEALPAGDTGERRSAVG